MKPHKVKYVRWLPYSGEIEIRAKNISLAKAEARQLLAAITRPPNTTEEVDEIERIIVRV